MFATARTTAMRPIHQCLHGSRRLTHQAEGQTHGMTHWLLCGGRGSLLWHCMAAPCPHAGSPEVEQAAAGAGELGAPARHQRGQLHKAENGDRQAQVAVHLQCGECNGSAFEHARLEGAHAQLSPLRQTERRRVRACGSAWMPRLPACLPRRHPLLRPAHLEDAGPATRHNKAQCEADDAQQQAQRLQGPAQQRAAPGGELAALSPRQAATQSHCY